MNHEKDTASVRQGWTLRECWLAAGLIVVSIAFAIEFSRDHEGRSSPPMPWDVMTNVIPAELIDVAHSSGEPLSDDADPTQAKNIHVPGQTNVASVASNSLIPARNSVRGAASRADTTREYPSRPSTKHDKEPTLLSQVQIDAALDALEAMEWGPDAERKFSTFIQQWAKQDPTAALGYALGIESNKARNSIMKSVFGGWMKDDPASAREWFGRMLSIDPLGVDSLAGMVYRDLAASNPAGVIAEISQLPGNSLKRSALSSVVGQLLAQDNIKALFTIHAAMEPGLDQDLLTEAILRGAGIYMPTEIASWALSLKDEHSRKLALDGVTKTWSADQPVSAAEWAMTLQDEEERSRAIATVAQNWARQDAVATGDWLLSMKPPTPALDPAVVNFVKAVKNENPAGAMAWVGAISDEKNRISLMTQIGKEWIKSDRDAALTFVNQTSLPESVLKAILAADPEKTSN